jgi:RNA recognition motif-containing protein
MLDRCSRTNDWEGDMSKLFVGNLSFKVTDADLQNWFEANGFPVESAEVLSDRKTGRSRGIGFVVLKRNDQLKDAIDKLHGQTFEGRTVNVEEAKSAASNEGPHPQKRGRW